MQTWRLVILQGVVTGVITAAMAPLFDNDPLAVGLEGFFYGVLAALLAILLLRVIRGE